jgi:hypothetical protein
MNKLKDAGSNTVNSRLGSRFLVPGVLLAGLGLGSCAEQPEVQCFAALSFYGPMTANYELKQLVSGTGCDKLKAEPIGLETYLTDPSNNKPSGINSLALKSQQMGVWVLNGESYHADPTDPDDPGIVDDDHAPYALGKFTSKHPKGDVCTVPKLSVARLVLPTIPEHTVDDDALPYTFHDEEGEDEEPMPDVIPEQPPLDVSYEWSNVRVYVTPADVGTQWAADLTYKFNGCVAKYTAVGVNVHEECETDNDCEKVQAMTIPRYGKLKCVDSSEPNPSFAGGEPDAKPFKKLCVLQGTFPVLKK